MFEYEIENSIVDDINNIKVLVKQYMTVISTLAVLIMKNMRMIIQFVTYLMILTLVLSLSNMIKMYKIVLENETKCFESNRSENEHVENITQKHCQGTEDGFAIIECELKTRRKFL